MGSLITLYRNLVGSITINLYIHLYSMTYKIFKCIKFYKIKLLEGDLSTVKFLRMMHINFLFVFVEKYV